MLIRPKKLAVDPSNPFALDKLNRLESATILTQLLERADTPLVLGLDAKWGNGKTTFLQMWQHYLSARGIQSMYFNAWESDYSDDPLISFIGEMGAQIKGHQKNKKSRQLTKAWEQVKKKGSTLAKRIVPVGLKVATAGMLDLDYVSEQALAGLAADIAKDKIENYSRDKNTVQDFKKQLAGFIKALSEQTKDGGIAKRIVFFVDELDRCRPTYSIALLERIKHFFDVEGLAFVLSLDKNQLSYSICAVYGSGIDVDGYLRRFIDIEYQLPTVSTGNFVAFLAEQYQLRESLQRIGRSDLLQTFPTALEIFDHLATAFELTLRKKEQTIAILNIVLLSTNLSSHLPFLFALAVIKIGDRSLYDGLLASTRNIKDLMERIEGSTAGRKFLAEDIGALFEAYCLSWKMNDDPTAHDRYAEYVNLADAAQGKHVKGLRSRQIKELTLSFSGMPAIVTSHYRALEISGQFKNL